jgi:ubiquinone/menaquinone biosynthesis C-methylase UbiE
MQTAYDQIAAWYQEWLGEGSASAEGDHFYTPLLELIGDVTGQRICDLACGQGRVSRHLAGLGAEVVGVDGSAAMLAIGAGYPEHPKVTFVHDSAHTLQSQADATFDGVLCNMALMDIPDLTATVHSAYRILRAGGWFGFTTLHPCFNTPRSVEVVDDDGRSHRMITDYFTEGFWQSDRRVGPSRLVGAYHRTLGTYLNTLIETGFTIGRVQEVVGRAECWLEVPPVLAMVCRKPG